MSDEIEETEDNEESGDQNEIEEQSVEEEHLFETTDMEEYNEEIAKMQREQRRQEVTNLLKMLDMVPNQTMHERLRHRYTTRLSKMVKYWMNENSLKGLDYYQYLMLMLKLMVTRRPNELKKKQRKSKLSASYGMVFVDKHTSSESTSSESEIEIDPIVKFSEEIKKKHPQLIENLKKKEKDRKERNLLDIQKLNNAVNAFNEEKKKTDLGEQDERLCYLEHKKPPVKKKISLDYFLKKEGFPTSPDSIPSEVFWTLGLNKETWQKQFPLMDEDDLQIFYKSLFPKETKDLQDENIEDDILKRRGRFRFQQPWQQDGAEEGEDINMTKWEQAYWKRQEEMERDKVKKKEKEETKEEDLQLCQLMMVRCGTSWKQELGYTEGWSDTARLGKRGRMDMETVAIKILKRGYKFDYVLTSTLGRAKKTADLMLSGSGQEKLIRYQCWELNPRHRGKLEGETELGTASRWGWLPQEWFAYTCPPPIGARDLMPENIARADPAIPETLPRAETVFHVQERVQGVWDMVRHMFIEKGKRTILMCAHKDSIEAMLFHIFGFQPTDFTAWQPSYTTPIILMFYICGSDFMPAFVDFLGDIDEADRQTENITICWFERFIDQRLLDDKTLIEIKKEMDKGEEPPELEALWNERFNKTLRNFEANAETIGQKLRQMNTWLERGYIVTPDEELKVTEDNTIFKEFMGHLETLEKAKDPLSDVLTLEERIMWVVNRECMTVDEKIKNLRGMWEMLLPNTDPEVKKLLKSYLDQYEKVIEVRDSFKESLADEDRSPEEKFKDKPPKCWNADFVNSFEEEMEEQVEVEVVEEHLTDDVDED